MAVRVVHTAAELNNEASGPSYSVPSLVYYLCEQGVDARLYAIGPPPIRTLNFPQEYYPKWKVPSALGVSPLMRRALHAAAKDIHIIHTHNLWMMPNMYPLSAAKRHGRKLVVTPRGTLTPWSMRYRWWKKRPIWWAYQRKVVAEADLLHVTSEDERDDVRSLGIGAPIAVLPNGVEVPPIAPKPERQRKTVLFLGRIHPKKGLDILLHSWRLVQSVHEDWDLKIVGPDNLGYKVEMQELARSLALQNCYFFDAVYGADKIRTYQAADLFVLPTHSENFGIAVAEALANGVPAVVTRGAPWKALVEQDAGWWPEANVSELASALGVAMSSSDDRLQRMGANARAWVAQSLSWSAIARKMRETYEWLLSKGARPEWVYLP